MCPVRRQLSSYVRAANAVDFSNLALTVRNAPLGRSVRTADRSRWINPFSSGTDGETRLDGDAELMGFSALQSVDAMERQGHLFVFGGRSFLCLTKA